MNPWFVWFLFVIFPDAQIFCSFFLARSKSWISILEKKITVITEQHTEPATLNGRQCPISFSNQRDKVTNGYAQPAMNGSVLCSRDLNWWLVYNFWRTARDIAICLNHWKIKWKNRKKTLVQMLHKCMLNTRDFILSDFFVTSSASRV